MTSHSALARERLEAERRSRMAESWAREQPSDLIIRAAFQRFERQSAERESLRKHGSQSEVWRYALIGVLAGVACMTLFSLGWTLLDAPSSKIQAPTKNTALASNPQVPPARAESAPETRQRLKTEELAFVQQGSQRLPVSEGLKIKLAASESATLVLGERRHIVRGPRMIEMHWSEQVAGWQMISTPLVSTAERLDVSSSKSAMPAEVGSEEPGKKLSELWKIAASAMRGRDYAAADVVLAELSSNANRETREAALLARAQLWIADGRTEQARPVLDNLKKNSSSAVVRERARNLLQRP